MTTLLEMTAHASVLIAFTALLRALALERLPKRTFTALWLVAAARMVLPLSLTVPAPAAPVSAVYRAVAQAAPAPAAARFPWATVLWLAGAAVCAGWLLRGHLMSLRRYREALPLHDPGVERLCRGLVPHRTVSVRLCQGLGTPLTYGFFRPVILLPSDLDRRDRRQLGYILAHELTHIRRGHIPFKYLLALALCLHWFNPLAWVMYILAGRDIELTCDEAVLRRTRDGRASYAMALIAMEERRAPDPLLSGFGAMAVRERIRQIMRFRPAGDVSVALAAALVLSSATVFAAAAENAAHPESEHWSPHPVSALYAAPTPPPQETDLLVAPDPTAEPVRETVFPTPEPSAPVLPTASPAPPAQVYQALVWAPSTPRPVTEEPAVTDPDPVTPTPPPGSTPAPMEAEPVPTPDTEEEHPLPTPDNIPAEPTPSPVLWTAETLPTPVHDGPDPLTPTSPATPAPEPADSGSLFS